MQCIEVKKKTEHTISIQNEFILFLYFFKGDQ